MMEFQSNGVDPDNAELPSPHSSTQQTQGEGRVAISHAVHRGAVIPGFWPSWEGAVSQESSITDFFLTLSQVPLLPRVCFCMRNMCRSQSFLGTRGGFSRAALLPGSPGAAATDPKGRSRARSCCWTAEHSSSSRGTRRSQAGPRAANPGQGSHEASSPSQGQPKPKAPLAPGSQMVPAL